LTQLRAFSLTRLQLMLATALWISLLPNLATLNMFYTAGAGHGLACGAFVLAGWLFVFTITFMLLACAGLVLVSKSIKLLCMVLLMAGAVLGYFSFFLGTQFDKIMLVNILQTHASETREMLNLRLMLWVVAVGVLPAWLVWQVSLRPAPNALRAALQPLALAIVCILASAAVIAPQYSRIASAARNRAVTFHTVAPANLIAAAISQGYALRNANLVRATRGLDAHQEYPLEKPRLVVLVLGETARAQNHGLNGYMRDTTPRMRSAGGLYFANTQSCGTATAISLPCIFSGFAREDFSLAKSRSNETLIDVALHSGARVLWLDNDAGCKDVCNKAEVIDLTNATHPHLCPEPGECFDEILLENLEAQVRATSKDTLLVLHLKGSHGPAYYKRYPTAFERYTPTCKSNDLSSCDIQSIINAYDNTIVYTDHIVGEVIARMKKVSDQFAPAVLYVSDHGESLGEAGLYLHGMPYAIAPQEQTRVPMYAWISPQFIHMEAWDTQCMAKQTQVPRSHDNVYATVLGLLEIETAEYKRALDLFKACDLHAGAQHPNNIADVPKITSSQ
jgi:lipid A ethanolaminephosphotransferase